MIKENSLPLPVYVYTITVKSKDLMTPEVIAEELEKVFEPLEPHDNKLRGVVTRVSRRKVETKE